VKKVVAWWEDETGLWLITDGDVEETSTLVEWWSREIVDEVSDNIVENLEAGDRVNVSRNSTASSPTENGPNGFESSGGSSSSGRNRRTGFARYGKAWETLLLLVNALQVSDAISRHLRSTLL